MGKSSYVSSNQIKGGENTSDTSRTLTKMNPYLTSTNKVLSSSLDGQKLCNSSPETLLAQVWWSDLISRPSGAISSSLTDKVAQPVTLHRKCRIRLLLLPVHMTPTCKIQWEHF